MWDAGYKLQNHSSISYKFENLQLHFETLFQTCGICTHFYEDIKKEDLCSTNLSYPICHTDLYKKYESNTTMSDFSKFTLNCLPLIKPTSVYREFSDNANF